VHAAPRQRDRVYAELKERLLAGEFALDARLGEVSLARELEVSRTPVREALLRLWSEGIVDRHPGGGFRPVMPDGVAIRELYDLREALERHAITLPARTGRHHDRDVLERLLGEWRSLASEPHSPDPDFVLLDESFHLGLAESAGNPALVDALAAVNDRIRIVRLQDFRTVGRIVATIDQHLAIVEALLADRPELAFERWRDHLAESLAVVEERSTEACLRMMRSGRRLR